MIALRASFAAAGLLLLSCGGASSSPEPAPGGAPEPVAFETLVQRSIPGQSGGTLHESARDEAAWTALWSRLREGGGDVLPAQPPAVDFSRDMTIAAALETQPCVSKVTLRKVTLEGGELVVDLLEAPPAPNCVCIVAERPIHVVRLPRSEAPVRFAVERGVTSCGGR